MRPDVEAALRSGFERPFGPGVPRRAVVAVRDRAGTETLVLARGGETAPDDDALFLLYSITKPFLAAAALRLAGEGALALDVPLARWLPSAPHAREITLRHLLRHESGLPDYGPLGAYHEAVRRGDEPWDDATYFARCAAARLRFAPGARFAYSNLGYLLVRRLLETVRGAPLADVLAQEVVAPLGLGRTFGPADADLPRLVLGPSTYLAGGAAAVPVAGHYGLGWVSHGVLASTAAETATAMDALVSGDLVPEHLRPALREARPVGPVAGGRPFAVPAYGLGLMADLGAACGPVFGHSGGGPGSTGTAQHRPHPDDPVTVVVLSDGEDGTPGEPMAMAALAGRCGRSG